MDGDGSPAFPDSEPTMRIQVDTPEEAGDLVEFLRSRIDTIVDRIGEAEVEVSLLGSFTQQAMREEVDARVRTWRQKRLESAAPGTVIPIDARLKLAATPADSGDEWSGQAASPNRPGGRSRLR
jgi:hypothetical protein